MFSPKIITESGDLGRDRYGFVKYNLRFVHKEIFLPLGTRFGVMTKQYVIKPETKQLLRRQ